MIGGFLHKINKRKPKKILIMKKQNKKQKEIRPKEQKCDPVAGLDWITEMVIRGVKEYKPENAFIP